MSRLAKLGAAVALVGVGVVLGVYLGAGPVAQPESSGSLSGGLLLARPAFAQTTQRIFLDDEAGISAYVKLDEELDLEAIRPLYGVIEFETDDYIIGTLRLAGYGTSWWPHLWVHKDGWIVAYYNKAEPTSRLMHWPGYRDGRITSNTLREGILSVASAIEVEDETIDEGLGYYHWAHPEATHLLMVVGTGTFRYTIPEAITVFEGSWSQRTDNIHPGNAWSELKIDGQTVFRRGKSGSTTEVEGLNERFLSTDEPHTVSVTKFDPHGRGWVAAAICFVYR